MYICNHVIVSNNYAISAKYVNIFFKYSKEETITFNINQSQLYRINL